MSAETTASASARTELQDSPFLKTLIALIRAEDSYGVWEKRPDVDLLGEFVLTREARRALPIMADPEPEVLTRVEQFYRTVGLRIEQRTGCMASPMMKMSHEGFGRVLLTTGKLVAFSKTLRDVHRFGFDDLATLGREGEKIVGAAVECIEQYPEVARA
ncbi:MAG TPA: NifX-associated nitrogen fixation protein [Polyangiales bacterium]